MNKRFKNKTETYIRYWYVNCVRLYQDNMSYKVRFLGKNGNKKK